MNSVNQSKRIKCPQCGGRGVVIKIIENDRAASWNMTRINEICDELRIPNLTGTKAQCEYAMDIRTRFIQKAKKMYQEDRFKIFIKLISYESHAIFWIGSKECNIAGLIDKIEEKNPTAYELIDRVR